MVEMTSRARPFLILVVNPGSTSTKVAVFENEACLCSETIVHQADDFVQSKGIHGQKEPRIALIYDFMLRHGIAPASLAAVVGRGGLVTPVRSGTYRVNEAMLADLRSGMAETHASSLGGMIAADIGARYGIPAYVVDPVVVDEMQPECRLSGIPQITRKSIFHALNSKAVARMAAAELGHSYEDCRFVVAHMGGGISVSAHRYGRVVDSNNALSGEGSFTPERCGALPVESVIGLCFSGEYTKDDMLAFCHKEGGMRAYLGTNDMRDVEQMIMNGDEHAALVLEAMALQVSKEIGAMFAVLEGRVTAILLTGGLAYSSRFTGAIKQRVAQMAQVLTYPGEYEMQALAAGALRVLTGREDPLKYGS